MQSEQSARTNAFVSSIASAIDTEVAKQSDPTERGMMYRYMALKAIACSMSGGVTMFACEHKYYGPFKRVVQDPVTDFTGRDKAHIEEVMFRIGQILVVRAYTEHLIAIEAVRRRPLALA